MLKTIKDIATEITPPFAVNTAKKVLHAIDKETRDSPFKYLPRDINPGWIMDIGANYGNVSESALKAFPNAKIICFEPVKETFDKLRERLIKYVPERAIYCQQIAISDFNGTAEMNITNYSPANSLNAQNSVYAHYNPGIVPVKKEVVKVSTLDSLLNDMPKKVDIVKIDVEGQEYEVLNGGTVFFRDRVDIIIIEISFQRERNGGSPTFLKVYNLLDAWGYELINMYDLDNRTYDDPNVIDNKMVVQVDCIFRKKQSIRK